MPSQRTTKASQAAAAKLEKYANAPAQALGQTPPKNNQQNQHTGMYSKLQVGAPAARKNQEQEQVTPMGEVNEPGGNSVWEGGGSHLKICKVTKDII